MQLKAMHNLCAIFGGPWKEAEWRKIHISIDSFDALDDGMRKLSFLRCFARRLLLMIPLFMHITLSAHDPNSFMKNHRELCNGKKSIAEILSPVDCLEEV